MMGLAILGATGSIGVSTLDVVARHPDRYRVVALSANTEIERLFQHCIVHGPDYAVMADAGCAQQLARRLGRIKPNIKVLAGTPGLETIAGLPQVDTVMAAIVGAAGLLPALAAVRAGKRILLANKEALVMSGKLFMDEAGKHNAELIPIDSEHNAVFQCLPKDFARGLKNVGVRRILLTASGGPFRTTPLDQLDQVTPKQACAHPNWVMGRKISVDSATMMNKGLEVIEACWLFNTVPANIQVVMHPQSVIHSMAEYEDGSVLAQLASPDMRVPIAHALAWPERMASGAPRLNLFDVKHLDFESVDLARFPCLRLALDAWRTGGTATAVLNAANEIAVQAFLDGRLPFTGISRVIESTLATRPWRAADSLEIILEDDAEARRIAIEELPYAQLGPGGRLMADARVVNKAASVPAGQE